MFTVYKIGRGRWLPKLERSALTFSFLLFLSRPSGCFGFCVRLEFANSKHVYVFTSLHVYGFRRWKGRKVPSPHYCVTSTLTAVGKIQYPGACLYRLFYLVDWLCHLVFSPASLTRCSWCMPHCCVAGYSVSLSPLSWLYGGQVKLPEVSEIRPELCAGPISCPIICPHNLIPSFATLPTPGWPIDLPAWLAPLLACSLVPPVAPT